MSVKTAYTFSLPHLNAAIHHESKKMLLWAYLKGRHGEDIGEVTIELGVDSARDLAANMARKLKETPCTT